MRPHYPGVVKGLNVTGRQALLLEPVFDDVQDVLDVAPQPVEGAHVTVQGTTATGILGTPGIKLWTGSRTYAFSLHSELSAIHRHTEACMGRVRSFWLPSWRTDFHIAIDVQPASSNVIHVTPTATLQYEFVFEPNRYGIFIELLDRTYHIYKIVGYDRISGRLTVNASLDTTFRADQVSRCSLIRRVRFDHDAFRWKFITDAVGSVTCNFVERPGEGVFVP